MVDLRPETWDAANPMAELRVFAAWHVLDAVASDWYPEFADWLLTNGVYTDAIREIAEHTHPYRGDVRPLFDRALTELAVTQPTRVGAAWMLTRRCIVLVVSAVETPEEVLRNLYEVYWRVEDLFPAQKYVGEALDIGVLLGNFWSYSAPSENYFEAEKRVITDETERRALLDTLTRREAAAWLTRHPERDE